MTITARFPGKCKACGAVLPEGSEVQWVKGKGTTCATCPAPDQIPTQPKLDETPAQADEVTVTEPGVYETPENEVYVVKPNRDKTRLYAKRLVEINPERATETGERVQIEFEYARGAIYRLTPAMKMPLERAKALTIRYGRCIVCGRGLKAAESVERGIGPVCVRSFRDTRGETRNYEPEPAEREQDWEAEQIASELEAESAEAAREADYDALMQARERDEAERVARFKAERDEALAGIKAVAADVEARREARRAAEWGQA